MTLTLTVSGVQGPLTLLMAIAARLKSVLKVSTYGHELSLTGDRREPLTISF
jgi:hypothetical protein